MSERGLCSRREADEYIERGWVYVDGVRVEELGTRIDPSQTITLDKRPRTFPESQSCCTNRSAMFPDSPSRAIVRPAH